MYEILGIVDSRTKAMEFLVFLENDLVPAWITTHHLCRASLYPSHYADFVGCFPTLP
jgi:hypothetical protein